MKRKEKGLYAPAPSKIPEMPKIKAPKKELNEIEKIVEQIEIEEGKKYILSIKGGRLWRFDKIRQISTKISIRYISCITILFWL